MPTSQPDQISKILNLIIALNPKSLLDIGVGFGKYGVLSREYLELWDGREDYSNFERKIDGIEVFEKYLTPLHKFIYNHVYIGDASKIIDEVKDNYDLVLLVDVLEHFEKDAGALLVQKILDKNGAVLISVPKNMGDQKDAFGNIHETHKAKWKKKDFKKFGKAHFVQDLESLIVLISKKDVIAKMRKNHLKRLVKKAVLSTSAGYAVARFMKKKFYQKNG